MIRTKFPYGWTLESPLLGCGGSKAVCWDILLNQFIQNQDQITNSDSNYAYYFRKGHIERNNFVKLR